MYRCHYYYKYENYITKYVQLSGKELLMKILHTSDWHLGAMDGLKSLFEDQQYFIDEICDIAAEKSVKAVIIAGDVYDRSVASAEAIKLYNYAMTRLCKELGAKVIVIAGNHDSAERLSSCRELLSTAGLYVTGAIEREISRVSIDNADIYMIPWLTEEKVKSVFPENKDNINSLEDAYNVVTNSIRESMDKCKRNIAVSHAFITDSETSTSDRAAEIGFAAQVSADVFDGFDYVALGHIHKPQTVSENARYCGTPMPYSFGKEEKQEKSVTIIDTDDMSEEIVPLTLLHVRKTISGTLSELLEAGCGEETKNGYLKLQVTDQYVGMETLSDLKRLYPNLLVVEGKTFDGDSTSVSMTMEEFEKLETNPIEVFIHFCKEEMNEEADDRIIKLFEKAIKAAEEEDEK